MIKFNIFYYNHSLSGRRSILDYIEWLYFEIKNYGYDVTISKKINLNAINILIDNFNYETAKFLEKKKIKFGVIATEILTENTFNFSNDKTWIKRRENFDQVTKIALFTLTQGANQNLNSYKNFYPFFMNYNDKIEKKYNKNTKKNNFFCFTGPITSFRKKILDDISKEKKIKISEKFLNKRNYANLLLETKYFLCIQQEERWPTISMSKIMQSLHHNCIPVVLKMPKVISNEISKFVVEIDKNNLAKEIDRLSCDYKKNLKKIEQYKQYKNNYNFKLFIQRCIIEKEISFEKEDNFIKSEIMGNNFFSLGPHVLKRGSQLIIKKRKIEPLDDISKYFIFINNSFLKKIIEFFIVQLKKFLRK